MLHIKWICIFYVHDGKPTGYTLCELHIKDFARRAIYSHSTPGEQTLRSPSGVCAYHGCGILPSEEIIRAISTKSVISTNVIPSGNTDKVEDCNASQTKRGQPQGLTSFCWWSIKDSNLGPTGYEPVALTN